jgi:hypothetical protein
LSLKFMPLPMFIIVAFVTVIGMFFIARKMWSDKLNLFPIGYTFLGLGVTHTRFVGHR